ncbi:PREDICTED: heat shock protein 68-like [Papilio xuthus]|uniref:Heat shock protein 68-like n=1 Tax=Papilio xuthus TaxID=66420 RepID=A0AAJ6Z1B4_PAPXU|nr:PREDICTED: heat shock protein 68-like [Papilio xuthus]
MVGIGIDLGTTSSCVAVWKKGSVEVITNEQGNRTTPSFVAFTTRERLIGEAAKNQATSNATNTIFGAKRLIGRRYDDVSVQMDLRHWPFEVINDKDTIKYVEQALKEARMKKEDINDVILIGGSTRIPKIRRLVQEYFDGRSISSTLNPEEAVACGAAIQAAILSGERHKKIQDLLLVDVVPLSLGVETARGMMYKIVDRNTPIPCRQTKDLTTLEDYQRSMTIEVFEGERALTRDNNLLGVFELDNIPPAPRGIAVVDVTFDIDANGILSVYAQDRSTGNKNGLIVTNEHRLNQQEINKMIADAEAFKEEDRENKRRLEVRNQLEGYVYSVKQTVSENIEMLSVKEISTLTKECKDAIEWLELNPDCLREEYERKMSELLTHWSFVMRRFNSIRHTAKRQKSDNTEENDTAIEEVENDE